MNAHHFTKNLPELQTAITRITAFITLVIITIAACIFFPYTLAWCQNALVGTGINLLAYSTIITLAAQATITFCGAFAAWRADSLLQAWHTQHTTKTALQQPVVSHEEKHSGHTEKTPTLPISSLSPHAFFTSPGHLTFSANTKIITSSMLTSIPKDQVKTVSIPAGVTRIPEHIFENFSNLHTVNLPNSISQIGTYAFFCTGLTHLTFPDNLTTIGISAFCGCSELTHLTFHDNLTTIGDVVFLGCTKLTPLTFPDSLTTIGKGAFAGCTGLTHVTFPDSLTTISDDAFLGCTNLKTLFIPDSLANNSAEYWQATGIDLNTTAMITSNKLDAFRRKNHIEKNTRVSEIIILYQAQQKLIPLPNTLTDLKRHTVTQLSLRSLTILPIEFHIIIPAIRLFNQIPTTTSLLQITLNPLGDKAMQAAYPLAEWITWIDAAKIWLAKSTGPRLPHHIQPHNATRRNKQRKTVYWEPKDANLTLYQDYATSTQAVSWEKSAPQKPGNRHHKRSIFNYVNNSFFPPTYSNPLSRHATQRPLFNLHPTRHQT